MAMSAVGRMVRMASRGCQQTLWTWVERVQVHPECDCAPEGENGNCAATAANLGDGAPGDFTGVACLRSLELWSTSAANLFQHSPTLWKIFPSLRIKVKSELFNEKGTGRRKGDFSGFFDVKVHQIGKLKEVLNP